MALLDDIFQRGYRETQEECAEHLRLLTDSTFLNDAGEEVRRQSEVTEDLIEQAAAPPEDGGWGWWLDADNHSSEILYCEPYTQEWHERSEAYIRGAERGAADWVSLQLIELDARNVEVAVRTEWPETIVMPREIMADWLEDRDDSRAETLRLALNPPVLNPS